MADVALRDYVKEIDGMIQNNSYDAAIAHGRHILTHYPKYLEAYRALGKASLEKEDDEAALDIFQRVLSVDPEDFVARVGLSIIYDRRDDLDRAIYHMERAFDLQPSNEVIQSELKRLHGRRDGVEPERISLTRGALARMYAQGDLYAEAITELRGLLAQQPRRVDLQVLLAEVLWRDDQRIEAAEWAQKVIEQLPYCLTANLILGEIMQSSGQDGDGETPFKRAQAVDPDNERAANLFSPESPLPYQPVTIEELERPSYEEMLEGASIEAEAEEVPDWLKGLADLATPAIEEPESAGAPRLPTGLHMPGTGPLSTGEIPDWLQGLTASTEEAAGQAETEAPNWLSELQISEPASAADQAIELPGLPAEAGAEAEVTEVPDWLAQLGEPMTEELPEAEPAPQDEVPDWIRELGTEAVEEQELPTEAEAPVEPAGAEEVPDWLAQLGSGSAEPETTVSEAPETKPAVKAGDTSDWLAQLRASAPSAAEIEPTEEIPDWLAQLRPTETAESAEESEQPDWLRELSEMEEIGPLQPAGEHKIELDVDRETVSRLVEAIGGEEEEPAAELEAAPSAELEEEVPSPDDALAFLASLSAGKEDELRAQAEAEAASRLDEIMGRKPAQPPVPTELVEPEVAEQVVEPGPEVVEFEMPEAGVAESAVPGIEAPAAEVPEAMPSPDDALAFLASLSAGQEDELRAQAEAEAAARLEEIMGRKPAAPQAPAMPEPEEARAELEAAGPEVAEAETAEAAQAEVAPVEVTPAEVPEVMPSPDDALAFLTRLSAGREDELRAQAETEAATRMDEIMGRKKPALPQTAELKPLEEPGGEAAVREPMAQVAAAEVIPKPPQAEVETAVQLPAQPAGAEEPMAFLQRLAEEKEAQLQAQPVEAPQPEMHVEVAVKVEAEGEPEPIAEQTVSLAVPVEAEAAEAEAVEAQAEVAEVEPTAVEEHVVAAPTPSAEWWVQIAEDEGEEPMAELPPMYQPPRPRPSPAAPRRREPAPVREPPPEAVRPAPAPAVVSIDVDPLLARLQLNENDHEARLELARAWWSTGSRDQALDEYNTLVRGGVHTDEVLGDLERIAEIDDHAEWSRLLGDVYMKAGKLPRALEAYRRALNRL